MSERFLSSSLLRKTILPVLLALRLVLFVSDVPLTLAAGATAETTYNQEENRYSPEEFLRLTNEARLSMDRPTLVLNEQLNQAAMAKAQDMVAKGYWDHFRPTDHKAPWAFVHEAGYQYTVAGENLARGYQTPAGITQAWLNSPSHLANILSRKYAEVGYACIVSFDASGKEVLLTVEMFGSR